MNSSIDSNQQPIIRRLKHPCLGQMQGLSFNLGIKIGYDFTLGKKKFRVSPFDSAANDNSNSY